MKIILTLTMLFFCGWNHLNAQCNPPKIFCPSDITIQCGASLDPSNTGTSTSIDGCGLVSTDFTTTASNTGCGYSRTWTVTDENGGSDECTQTITISDVTPPSFDPPANTIVEKPLDFDPVPVGPNIPLHPDLAPALTGLPSNVMDNCTGTLTPQYQDIFEYVGPKTMKGEIIYNVYREWTLVNACGNPALMSSSTQTIEIALPSTIPTIGEWGLIILSLLLISIGVVRVKKRTIELS